MKRRLLSDKKVGMQQEPKGLRYLPLTSTEQTVDPPKRLTYNVAQRRHFVSHVAHGGPDTFWTFQ